MKIYGEDFDSAFKQTLGILSEQPNTNPRGLLTKELINATMVIENPLQCVLTNPHRKLSEKYLSREFDWYLSGELNIDRIKDHASMWSNLLNPDGKTVNSNYGYYVFKQETNGLNQFDWVVESLKNDSNSRQAIINFNQPVHKFKENKDFVCTVSMQFFIRNNSLISLVNMRSCDIIYGAGYDIPWFSYVQFKVWESLTQYYKNLKIGRMEHTSASLHVYEKHFKMMFSVISDNKNYISKNVLTIPTFYTPNPED